MSKKLKILMAVLIILIIFFVYSVFFSGDNKKENNLSVSNNATQTGATAKTDSFAEGQEILDMLSSLKSVKMDTSFFNDKTFKSLVDFSVEIAPQPAGRSNPFSPI